MINIEEYEKNLTKFFDEYKEFLIKKKKDYGNNFENMADRFGDIIYLIRITDKLQRAENLIMNKQEPENESLLEYYLLI